MLRLRQALATSAATLLLAAPASAGTIDIGRGAGGATLGMGRAEVLLALGLPTTESASTLSYTDSAGVLTLHEAAGDGLIDRMSIRSRGPEWRLSGGESVFTRGALVKIRHRFGSRLRPRRDPALGRAYVIAGRYQGRSVRTAFVVDRFTPRTRVKRVVIEFTSVAPAPATLKAPGRVVYPQDREAPGSQSNSGPFLAGVAQPDGRLVLARREVSGVGLIRLEPDGREDRSFGLDGTVHLPVTFAPLASGFTLRVRPDGRLLLAVAVPGVTPQAGASLDLIALTAGGALDGSFGAGGLARSQLAFGCGQCASVTIGPDGDIVIAGMTGTPPVVQGGRLVTPAHYRWAVEHLHPDGTPDLGFGTGGVTVVSTSEGTGSSATFRADGSVATTGYAGNTPELAVLHPDGSPDTSFNGGAPVPLSGFVDDAPVERPDGTLDLLTRSNGAMQVERIARSGVAGSVVATLPVAPTGDYLVPAGALLSLPGGDELFVGVQSTPFVAPVTRISAISMGADGSVGVPVTARPLFGGGRASGTADLFVTSQPPVDQTAFTAAATFAAPGGRIVMTGAVSIAAPAGEEDAVLNEPAILVVDHGLQPDPRFGAPTAPTTTLRAAVADTRVDVTWTATIAIPPRVTLRLDSSGPGLAAITVTAGGSTIAQETVDVPRIGRQLVGVALTRDGLTKLRRHAPLRVHVTAHFRDVLGGQATATAVAELRPGTLRCPACPR
ncbi:hypothetical protein [Solirubrobacter soli]|uniref:hypothetical protein n=1 Tax=Solirubrobacter soli TaxID=363832 RepID=UPI00041F1032|nr:hypothetical protein [Solirubrobacter soli]